MFVSSRWHLIGAFLTSGIIMPGIAAADRTAAALTPDEALLRAVGLKTDTATLCAFFQRQNSSTADRKRLAAIVRQLSDDAFETREKATTDALVSGPVIVPYLRGALTDSDRERRRRAMECLVVLSRSTN